MWSVIVDILTCAMGVDLWAGREKGSVPSSRAGCWLGQSIHKGFLCTESPRPMQQTVDLVVVI